MRLVAGTFLPEKGSCHPQSPTRSLHPQSPATRSLLHCHQGSSVTWALTQRLHSTSEFGTEQLGLLDD